VHRPYTKSEKSQEDLAKEATIQYWLFKSEPDAWSWDQQKKEGAKGAEWDGVRNYQARNVMRQMKKGDLGFFYHSGEERRVVGVVKVVAEAHPDSTDGTGIWECVDVAAVSAVKKPVTLAKIKATKSLKDMVLVNNSRLSVQPVSAGEWVSILKMAGMKGFGET
jgi:predicted RNA-binding protein with PUA-like domain